MLRWEFTTKIIGLMSDRQVYRLIYDDSHVMRKLIMCLSDVHLVGKNDFYEGEAFCVRELVFPSLIGRDRLIKEKRRETSGDKRPRASCE